jgi:IS5 family transposase
VTEIYVVLSDMPPKGDVAGRHIWTTATLGMKLHTGVDSQSGLAHSAVVTPANVHDKHPLPDLLHGNEQRVYGDSAYASQKRLIASKASKAKDFTNQRARFKGFIGAAVRAKNRSKSRIRARVEHVFGVVKRLWGFGKVRYRGLQKNATRAFTALALANIYLGQQGLLAQVRP